MFSPGWPQTHYVTEDGLKLLICLSLTSKHWHSRTIPPLPIPSSVYPSHLKLFNFSVFFCLPSHQSYPQEAPVQLTGGSRDMLAEQVTIGAPGEVLKECANSQWLRQTLFKVELHVRESPGVNKTISVNKMNHAWSQGDGSPWKVIAARAFEPEVTAGCGTCSPSAGGGTETGRYQGSGGPTLQKDQAAGSGRLALKKPRNRSDGGRHHVIVSHLNTRPHGCRHPWPRTPHHIQNK